MFATQPTWTPDRTNELRRLYEAGLSCGEIAREISVTRNAVIGKLSRLGLSRPQGSTGRRLPPREGTRRIVAVLRAETESPVASETICEGRRCSLFELSPQSCRWPIGNPGADNFAFCGNAPVAGLPYCSGHARVAYQPAARRAGAVSGGR